MFGGHGIFHKGKMFGMVDSKKKSYLKANESNASNFENMGPIKHRRMPYYSVPKEIQDDSNQFITLAKKSIEISK